MVMGCTLLSRLLGFVRIAVIGALFGASGKADVLNAVFAIPNNLRKLLAEGALSAAFIPSLSAAIVDDKTGSEAREITRKVLSLQLIILIPLISISILLARPIISVLLPFPELEKIRLSTDLFRWVFPYVLFISISAVIMAVLNSNNVFVIPALTPLFFSVCVIGSIILLYKRLDIFSLAAGILLGGMAQIAFQLPKYTKLKYDFKIDLHFRAEPFKKVMKQWVPVLVSASIFAVNQQIAVLFASGLENGSTSALSYALVFWQLPLGIFSTSIMTVLFPRMSKQSAIGDVSGLIESVSYGLRFIIILMIPASVVYILMGKEIISVALQRHKFTSSGTLMASNVLSAYSLGLFSIGGFNFLQRFFYSLKDYKTPLIVSGIVCSMDIILSLMLKETYLRVTGLALANSIAFSAGFILLIIRARIKLGSIKGKLIFQTTIKVALTSFIIAGFILISLKITKDYWTEGSSFVNFGLIMLILLGCGVITIGIYWLTGVDILKDILKQRLGKK